MCVVYPLGGGCGGAGDGGGSPRTGGDGGGEGDVSTYWSEAHADAGMSVPPASGLSQRKRCTREHAQIMNRYTQSVSTGGGLLP